VLLNRLSIRVARIDGRALAADPARQPLDLSGQEPVSFGGWLLAAVHGSSAMFADQRDQAAEDLAFRRATMTSCHLERREALQPEDVQSMC
jgi:hypothetical protein